jgi:hypothetical protein
MFCAGGLVDALETNGVREDTLVLVTGDNGPWEVRDCAPILLTGAAGAAGSGDEAAGFSISSSLRCWSDSCCSDPLAPAANLAAVNCVFDCVKVKCNLTGSKGPYLGTWQQENGGGSSAKTTLWEAGHRSETTTHTLCRLHVCLPGCRPGYLATWLAGWLAGWLADWLAGCRMLSYHCDVDVLRR